MLHFRNSLQYRTKERPAVDFREKGTVAAASRQSITANKLAEFPWGPRWCHETRKESFFSERGEPKCICERSPREKRPLPIPPKSVCAAALAPSASNARRRRPCTLRVPRNFCIACLNRSAGHYHFCQTKFIFSALKLNSGEIKSLDNCINNSNGQLYGVNQFFWTDTLAKLISRDCLRRFLRRGGVCNNALHKFASASSVTACSCHVQLSERHCFTRNSAKTKLDPQIVSYRNNLQIGKNMSFGKYQISKSAALLTVCTFSICDKKNS